MRNLTPIYALATVLLLPGLLPGCAIESKYGPDGCHGDAKITANIRTIFDQHPDLGAPAAIQVQTVNHVVYLNGLVDNGLERDLAASLAGKVSGVARVENNIAVTH
jgi:osmotically-inducible protein OsmY